MECCSFLSLFTQPAALLLIDTPYELQEDLQPLSSSRNKRVKIHVNEHINGNVERLTVRVLLQRGWDSGRLMIRFEDGVRVLMRKSQNVLRVFN